MHMKIALCVNFIFIDFWLWKDKPIPFWKPVACPLDAVFRMIFDVIMNESLWGLIEAGFPKYY